MSKRKSLRKNQVFYSNKTLSYQKSTCKRDDKCPRENCFNQEISRSDFSKTFTARLPLVSSPEWGAIQGQNRAMFKVLISYRLS